MRKRHKRRNKYGSTILNHVRNNKKEYIIVTIIFLIGLLIGIIFINNTDDMQKNEIESYIQSFINTLKNGNYEIDKTELLKNSITENIKLVAILWFMGSTVIGVPVVYGTVGVRGFTLGYTISAMIATLRKIKWFIINSKFTIIKEHNLYTSSTGIGSKWN